MKLKKNVDLVLFIRRVIRCRGDVWFTTKEGDRLNLKSTMSQFLFSMVSGQTELIESGQIELQENADLEKIEDFLK